MLKECIRSARGEMSDALISTEMAKHLLQTSSEWLNRGVMTLCHSGRISSRDLSVRHARSRADRVDCGKRASSIVASINF